MVLQRAPVRPWASRGDGGSAWAPQIVIDAQGREVAVVIDHAQYVALMRLLASGPQRLALSSYWRRALEGCLEVSGDTRARD